MAPLRDAYGGLSRNAIPAVTRSIPLADTRFCLLTGQVALIGAKGAPKAPVDGLAGGSVVESHANDYGEVRLLNYDAEHVTMLRGEHRNLYK